MDSSNSKKIKRKKKMEEKRKGWILAQKLTWIYLAVMGGIFPLYYQNGFFNILFSKYAFFGIATGIYAAVMVVLLAFCLRERTHRKRLFWLSSTDKWVLFFLVCCLISQIFTQYKDEAWSGAEGRYNGLLAMLLYILSYVMVSRGYRKSKVIPWIFFLGGAAVNQLAVLNHFMIDPLNIQMILSKEQQSMFISTIGNINIFSGFASMYVSMAFLDFCTAEKKSSRIRGIVGILIGMAGLIAGNSDGGFLGLIAVCIFSLIVFHVQKRFLRPWVYGMILIFATSGMMGLFQELAGKGAIAYKGGVAQVFADTRFFILAVAIGVIYPLLLGAMRFLKKKNFTKKQLLSIVLLIMVLCAVIAVAVNYSSLQSFFRKSALLEFDDQWGTYRGFVWKRCFWIYLDLPLLQKIFGCGLETIRMLMNQYYRSEMIQIAGRIYDNAHNEYLQYLVTIGFAGLTAYVGILCQSVGTALRYSKKHRVLLVWVAGVIAYAAQSTVNISQSAITFFLFLWIALIEGARRAEIFEQQEPETKP